MLSGVQNIEEFGHCNSPSNIYLQVCEKYIGLCHTQHFYFYEGDKDIGEFLDILRFKGLRTIYLFIAEIELLGFLYKKNIVVR